MSNLTQISLDRLRRTIEAAAETDAKAAAVPLAWLQSVEAEIAAHRAQRPSQGPQA